MCFIFGCRWRRFGYSTGNLAEVQARFYRKSVGYVAVAHRRRRWSSKDAFWVFRDSGYGQRRDGWAARRAGDATGCGLSDDWRTQSPHFRGFRCRGRDSRFVVVAIQSWGCSGWAIFISAEVNLKISTICLIGMTFSLYWHVISGLIAISLLQRGTSYLSISQEV